MKKWLKRLFGASSDVERKTPVALLPKKARKKKVRFRRDLKEQKVSVKDLVRRKRFNSEIAFVNENGEVLKIPYIMDAYTTGRFYRGKNFYIVLHWGTMSPEEEYFDQYVLEKCPYFLGYVVRDKKSGRYKKLKRNVKQVS